ncbi:MAG: S-layer homology domain-containing protein [Caldiserica bacterium]|jgi:hypothetical protein|nr:S-layer homology domain-containing protein [Caldisericota bacterium]
MKLMAFRNFLTSMLLGVLVISVPVVFPTEEPLSVTLIQPNGGETLAALKVFEIQWTTSATGGNIGLQYSLDSGKTWTDIAYFPNPASKGGEKGAYVWLVPPVKSDHGRIRVIWSPKWGESVWDVSDGDFAIQKIELAFPDVPLDYWAFQEISALTEAGVISGYPDGAFRPDNPVSRAEFAKMVLLSFGLSPIKPERATFPDVPPEHWAFGYVEAAVKAGLVKGYPDGAFKPDGEITKAEMITVLVRSLGWVIILPSSPTFSDCSPEDWYYRYIETASGNGLIPLDVPQIVRTDSSGALLFDPALPATRAQTAFFLLHAKEIKKP